MNWNFLTALLAMGQPPPPGTQQNPTAQMLHMLGMFAMMGFVFYFLLIRPQQKKQKAHDLLLKTLKNGDRVLTSGGIVGVVVGIKDKTVSLRSADTKLEVLKSAVSEVTERAADGNQA